MYDLVERQPNFLKIRIYILNNSHFHTGFSSSKMKNPNAIYRKNLSPMDTINSIRKFASERTKKDADIILNKLLVDNGMEKSHIDQLNELAQNPVELRRFYKECIPVYIDMEREEGNIIDAEEMEKIQHVLDNPELYDPRIVGPMLAKREKKPQNFPSFPLSKKYAELTPMEKIQKMMIFLAQKSRKDATVFLIELFRSRGHPQDAINIYNQLIQNPVELKHFYNYFLLEYIAEEGNKISPEEMGRIEHILDNPDYYDPRIVVPVVKEYQNASRNGETL